MTPKYRSGTLFRGLLLVIGLFWALLTASCGRQAPTYEPGSITVTSTPPGAAILFDGENTGQVTPYTFSGLEPDLYQVTVQLPTFVPVPGQIPVDLKPLDNATADFNLSRTGISLSGYPAGARVLINGNDTGLVTTENDTTFVAGLEPGVVDLTLALDTYHTFPPAMPLTITEGEIIHLPGVVFQFRSRRVAVLEGFANINCPPCPQLTANLLELSAQPGFGSDRLMFLEFAVNWPNPADPFYQHNTTENTDRFTRYFVLGAPALYSDGVGLPDALDASAMEASVTASLQTDPGFLIDVTAEFDNPSVPVTVELWAFDGLNLAGHSLYVALYEKVIDLGTPPGNNGQSVFHHVFRDRVDSPPSLGMLQPGTPEEHLVDLQRGDWSVDNLVVVAFVQNDADDTILQAGSTETPAFAKASGIMGYRSDSRPQPTRTRP